jgi:hypothetical protein
MSRITGSSHFGFYPRGTAHYLDNFESYTSGALGGQGDWIQHLNSIYVNAGTIRSNYSGVTAVCYNKDLAPDQWAQIEVTAVGDINDAIGVGLHMTGTGSTACGYGYYSMNGTQRLWVMINGVKTNIGTTGTAAMAVGDVLRLEIINGVLYAYHNDVLDTGVGSSGTADISSYGNYTTGQAGIVGYYSADTYADNFRCGDIITTSQITGGIILGIHPEATVTDITVSTSPIKGTAAVLISPAGEITGHGTIQGTAALSTIPAGILKGCGAIQGTINLTITPTGATKGRVSITGTVTLGIVPEATIKNIADPVTSIQGTANLGVFLQAVIQGKGALSGTGELVFNLTGTFRKVDAPLLKCRTSIREIAGVCVMAPRIKAKTRKQFIEGAVNYL